MNKARREFLERFREHLRIVYKNFPSEVMIEIGSKLDKNYEKKYHALGCPFFIYTNRTDGKNITEVIGESLGYSKIPNSSFNLAQKYFTDASTWWRHRRKKLAKQMLKVYDEIVTEIDTDYWLGDD